MEPQTVPPTVTQKLPYEPPKATFVPLKLEERLLACSKETYCVITNSLLECSTVLLST